MATAHIADKLVKAAAIPAKGNTITYDDEIKGFGIRVTANGKKAFILNYHIHGRERRMTIGQYPAWSVLKAREAAKIYRQEIDLGIDPLQERTDEHSAATLQDMFARYTKEHLPKLAGHAQKDQGSMFDKWILPELGKHTKVKDVTHDMVDSLHRKITGAKKPVRANRIIEVLRKAFNLAIRWGWITINPCAGTHRNNEVKRTSFLEENQLKKILELLDKHPEITSARALKFIIYTGARRGEVFKARWSEFDLANGIWTKPSAHTKAKIEHKVRLVAYAVDLLKAIKADATEPSKYVFPGKMGKPLTEIRRTWKAVCKEAGVANVRVHDQRRTFASILASNNVDWPVIGHFLGHTQTQTTLTYAKIINQKQHDTTKAFDSALNTIQSTNYDEAE